MRCTYSIYFFCPNVSSTCFKNETSQDNRSLQKWFLLFVSFFDKCVRILLNCYVKRVKLCLFFYRCTWSMLTVFSGIQEAHSPLFLCMYNSVYFMFFVVYVVFPLWSLSLDSVLLISARIRQGDSRNIRYFSTRILQSFSCLYSFINQLTVIQQKETLKYRIKKIIIFYYTFRYHFQSYVKAFMMFCHHEQKFVESFCQIYFKLSLEICSIFVFLSFVVCLFFCFHFI